MDNKIYREVYVTQKRRIEPLPVVNGSAVPIQIKVMDFDLSGTEADVYTKCKSGYRHDAVKATVSSNVISFTPSAGMFEAGNNDLQVIVKNATNPVKNIFSFTLPVVCDEDLSCGGASPNAEDVKSLVERAQTLANLAATVAGSIPSDYTALSNEVTSLSGVWANLEPTKGDGYTKGYVKGSFNPDTIISSTSTNYIRTPVPLNIKNISSLVKVDNPVDCEETRVFAFSSEPDFENGADNSAICIWAMKFSTSYTFKAKDGELYYIVAKIRYQSPIPDSVNLPIITNKSTIVDDRIQYDLMTSSTSGVKISPKSTNYSDEYVIGSFNSETGESLVTNNYCRTNKEFVFDESVKTITIIPGSESQETRLVWFSEKPNFGSATNPSFVGCVVFADPYEITPIEGMYYYLVVKKPLAELTESIVPTVIYNGVYSSLKKDIASVNESFSALTETTANLFYCDNYSGNGITLTTNSDGSITIDGSSTKSIYLPIMGAKDRFSNNLPAGNYVAFTRILDGTCEGGSPLFFYYGDNQSWFSTGGKQVSKVIESDTNVYLRIYGSRVFSKYTFQAAIFKGDVAPAYVPHITACDYYARSLITDDKNSLPLNWESDLDDKVDVIMNKMSQININSKMMHFLFYTDYHIEKNDRNIEPILKYLLDKTDCTTIVFGGDAITYPTDKVKQTSINLINAFKSDTKNLWGQTLPVIGNHDWSVHREGTGDNMVNTRILGIDNLLNSWFTKNGLPISGVTRDGNYYVDYDSVNVRVLFLSCDYTSSISTSSLKWVAKTLRDTPDDYSVLVFTHRFLRYNNSESGYIYATGSPMLDPWKSYTDSTLSNLARLLTYFKAHESVTIWGVTYNYTQKTGTVIGVIAGHTHYDVAAYFRYDETTNNVKWRLTADSPDIDAPNGTTAASGSGDAYIPAMSVTCAQRGTSFINDVQQSRLPVSSEKYTEESTAGNVIKRSSLPMSDIRRYALDDILIDLSARKMYFTRIGAGFDYEMTF